MKFIKIIILALLFVLALVLIIQNQEVFTHQFELKLNLGFYQIGPYITSNLLLIVASFLIGVVFAVIWGAFYAASMRGEIKEKNKIIKELQQKRETQVSPAQSSSSEEADNMAK
ncbi:hypothetical protein HRbin37_00657 [bacterium HR37]|nr:hypothetical protein HRbin37_00657 [bacterium HR37]